MEMDYELLRRYAGMQEGKISLEQAKQFGFVQDANDELLWAEAGKNPAQYLDGQPDTEIANLNMSVDFVDELVSRLGLNK